MLVTLLCYRNELVRGNNSLSLKGICIMVLVCVYELASYDYSKGTCTSILRASILALSHCAIQADLRDG